MANPALILASTSTYRRELLTRLHISFAQTASRTDEELRSEAPEHRALRLAQEKARNASAGKPDDYVIGSDQVCSVDGEVLRKPGSAARQRAQLAHLSGKQVRFDTAVSLARNGKTLGTQLVPTQVQFRELAFEEISAYTAREPATDCAGGFKVEGLGISLFRWVRSDDPTALVGLPLIATAELLREFAPSLFPGPPLES